MSDTQSEQEVFVPGTTEELLPWLQQYYPVDELQGYIRRGDLAGAQAHQARLDMISELVDLWNEQKKRANEVAPRRRRS